MHLWCSGSHAASPGRKRGFNPRRVLFQFGMWSAECGIEELSFHSAIRTPHSALGRGDPAGQGGPLNAPVEQWRVHHSVKVEARVQFPSGALLEFGRHGTPIGRAAELKPRRCVGSTPTRATESRVGRVLGDQAVCKTAAACWVGSIPTRRTEEMARSSMCGEDTGPSNRKEGFDSPAGHSGTSSEVNHGRSGERPTSRPANLGDVAQLVEATVSEAVRCGFDSHRHHCLFREAASGLLAEYANLAKRSGREPGACGFDSHLGHCLTFSGVV
jgi:hypothetical protein